jgi:hypothetical protein
MQISMLTSQVKTQQYLPLTRLKQGCCGHNPSLGPRAGLSDL